MARARAVDRRGADPRTGMFSEEFVRLARAVLEDGTAVADERARSCACTTGPGGARLLACRHCGELARCTRCGAAASRPREEDVLRCPRCGETRPVVCAACGRLRMKTLRAGVSRSARSSTALLGTAVGEVAGAIVAEVRSPHAGRAGGGRHRGRAAPGAACDRGGLPRHRPSPAGATISATEDTLALLVRAAGWSEPGAPARRGPACRSRPGSPTILSLAVSQGEPATVLGEEVAIRRASGLPPFASLALVSGTSRRFYADALEREASGPATSASVSVSRPWRRPLLGAGRPDGPLCDLLARVPRPPGRGLRVEVDPVAL